MMQIVLYPFYVIAIFFLTLYVCPVYCTQALYPLFTCPNGELYVMKQCFDGTTLKTQVILWDEEEGQKEIATSSLCMPTNITPLPNYTGFSFVDNGMIKIKRFVSRSAQRIEPDIPIFSPTKPVWITDDWFLVSAYYADRKGIFLLSTQGIVIPVLYSAVSDYELPSLTGGHLFCLRHDIATNVRTIVQFQGSLTQLICKQEMYSMSFDQRLACMSRNQNPDQVVSAILDCTQPVILFVMTSSDKGYFLHYSKQKLENGEDGICFICIQCNKKKSGKWRQKSLFTFNVPLSVLVGEGSHRLVESVLAIAPCYTTTGVCYVDAVKTSKSTYKLMPFFYSFASGVSTSLLVDADDECLHYVTPYVVNNHCLLGGLYKKEARIQRFISKLIT